MTTLAKSAPPADPPELFGGMSLARQFILAATIVLILGMAVIAFWVTSRIEDSVTRNAAAATALYVDSVIAPLTQELADSQALGEGARLALTETLGQGVLGNKLVSFKIWKPDGTVVFSNQQDIVGRQFPMTGRLRGALAGAVQAEFDQLDSAENAEERAKGIPLLEIYSPIRQPWSGRVIGVAEFYEIASDLQSDLALVRKRSWIVVGLVTLAMLGTLFGIVARGSRLIARQADVLRDRFDELNRLLHSNRSLRLRAEKAAHRTATLNEQYLRRISAELHDGPAQLIALACLRLETATKGTAAGSDLENVTTSLEEALREVRNICHGLMLPELDDLGTEEILKRVIKGHESRTRTTVDFQSSDNLPDLNQAEKIGVYRFVQETLNNAFRHANGIAQKVIAGSTQDGLSVTVSDEGQGFDAARPDKGLGLTGLEERLAGLGGTFAVKSSPGRGTTVTMHIPGAQDT
ncbi:sensor histidine kinase [Candidatus Phyllobacterium onerii]|uniref:sensor histidine kinase n=1 Tax=Candidatus Phyllobacterium onerii TaxID=3020828 RepID=UPI00232E3B77|nr:sensor histidine kinase [Phyllobacterium sp. IY22]